MTNKAREREKNKQTDGQKKIKLNFLTNNQLQTFNIKRCYYTVTPNIEKKIGQETKATVCT